MAAAVASATGAEDVLFIAADSGLAQFGNAQAPIAASADAKGFSVDGAASAAATLLNAVGFVATDSQNGIQIGGMGTVATAVRGEASALASTSGASPASADVYLGDATQNSLGGFIDLADQADVDFSIGNAAIIRADVQLAGRADSQSTLGDSSANAILNGTGTPGAANRGAYGFYQIGVAVADSGTLTSLIGVDLSSDSRTVGQAAAPVTSTALTLADEVVAIRYTGIGAGDFAFGNDGVINASAGRADDRIRLASNATAVSATASATSTLATAAGLLDDNLAPTAPSPPTLIEIGGAGTVNANALSEVVATASTTSGMATSDSQTLEIVGIQTNTLTMGDQGTVQGVADAKIRAGSSNQDGGDSTALASLTDYARGIRLNQLNIGQAAIAIPAGAGILGSATVDLASQATSTASKADANSRLADGNSQTPDVVGLMVDTATVGRQAALQSAATVDSDAVAVTVSGSDATATSAWGGAVRGITDSNMAIGDRANSLNVSGSLTSKAAALNTTGIAKASSGEETYTLGLYDSTIATGSNLSSGARFTSLADLSSQATSVGNSAAAFSGGQGLAVGWGTAAGMASSNSLPSQTSLLIGSDGGSIVSEAKSTIAATASTTGSLPGVSTEARASGQQQTFGISDSPISIGRDADVQAVASTQAAIASNNVGAQAGADDAAIAELGLINAGLWRQFMSPLAPDAAVSIARNGNVDASSMLSGSGGATTTHGDATASSRLFSLGIMLGGPTFTIGIGQSGNVDATAQISGQASGASLAENPLSLAAITTNGVALSESLFYSSGISGLASNATTIMAGPRGGGIDASGSAALNLTASTVGDAVADSATALAGSALSGYPTVVGIQDANLVGGLVGVNEINARAVGLLKAQANSVAGNSEASGGLNGYGILSNGVSPDSITNSGNIHSIAAIANTFTARSVLGTANSNGVADARAISNYSVNIIGSGIVTSQAISTLIGDAQSVSGDVG